MSLYRLVRKVLPAFVACTILVTGCGGSSEQPLDRDEASKAANEVIDGFEPYQAAYSEYGAPDRDGSGLTFRFISNFELVGGFDATDYCVDVKRDSDGAIVTSTPYEC